MSDNIKVVVRARPHQKCNTEFVPWIIDEKKIFQIDLDKTHIGDTYSYDEVFNVDSKNSDIYETSISPLVSSAVEGINLTIFAYGATSSGKTYTMNGTLEDPGIIPRFIEHIFDQVEQYSQRKFLIRVSYVEIYSEIINDLLDKTKKDLKIREDLNNCVSYNPKEQIVKSSIDCMQVMKTGAYNRTVGETQLNQCSSRSHAIFRIVIESAPTSAGEDDPVQVSQINLIDLAGSERASQTGATGYRLKEGAHINKSLTALGLVIKQLVEKNEYVNFRDSKLTRILSNSLGGNAKTVIICNINLESLEDTASTLMFAQRAKSIKNKPKVNEVVTEAALTKQYAKECAEIKKLLESELEKNKQLEVERETSNEKIFELTSRIKSFQEMFVKKEPLIRPPKRRHTISTLSAISEEKELENASRNLVEVGLREEGDIPRCPVLNSLISPPRRKSVNDLEIRPPTDETPVKNLRQRLEILTHEHEELIEYTREEKCQNQAILKKLEQVESEYNDLKLLSEAKDQQLKLEKEKAHQTRIDYEYFLETQKKKFDRRESELLEEISKVSTIKPNIEQPTTIENLPLPNMLTVNTFKYEEMSEQIASCQNQIEKMQNSNETLKLENDNLNVIIANLRKSVNTLELQNSQLKIKNKSLQTKVLDMEVKVNNSRQFADSSNNGIDSLKKQIQGLEENNKELKTELGKLKDELYESQDKLIEVTEDLDIEEKKSSRLQNQLDDEKKFRKDSESQLFEERVSRQQTESELAKESVLRQEIESELVKEKLLRQQAESELVKEKLLRLKAEPKLNKLTERTVSELVDQSQLGQEIESNFAPDSVLVTQTNLEREIESEFTKDWDLLQKLQLELISERDLRIEAETKYFQEVDLRKDIKPTLCTLHNILKPRCQLNDLLTKNTKTIVLDKPKESISEFGAVQDTSEIISESDLDMRDITVFTTPNESMQEIDQENLESFSSSYFRDSSKSNNFMNFFNSFVSDDKDISRLSQNNQAQKDEKEGKADILTSNKLQARLEEKNYMNLSDSEKISETNKILQDLNSLEAEKAENLSMIQKLKDQVQNEAIRYKELQKILELESDDLKRKDDEIHMLHMEIGSNKNEKDQKEKELLSKVDENLSMIEKLKDQIQNEAIRYKELEETLELTSGDLMRKNEEIQMLRKEISLNKIEKDQKEKEILLRRYENFSMIQKLEDQIQNEAIRYKELQTILEHESGDLARKNEEIAEIKTDKIKLEKDNIGLSGKINDLKIQVQIQTDNLAKLNEIIENKKQSLQRLTMDSDKLQAEKNNIQYMLKEECEKNVELLKIIEKLGEESQNLISTLKANEKIMTIIDENKHSLEKKNEISIQNNEKDANRIKELENKIAHLSFIIQEKEKIIVSIGLDRTNLQEEKNNLFEKINNLMIQVQTQTNQLAEIGQIIEIKTLGSQQIMKENDILKKKQEQIELTLQEEKRKNADFLKTIEELEIKCEKLSSSVKEKENLFNNKKKHDEDILRSIEELKTENAKLTRSLSELSNINSEKINEIRSIKKWWKNEKDLLVSKMKNDQMENEKEKKKLLLQIDDLKATVEMQLVKIKELQELINDNVIQMKKLKCYNQELEREIKNKEMSLAKAKEQVEMLEIESKLVDDLKKENSALVDCVLDFGNVKLDLENKIQDLRADFSEKLGDHITKVKSLFGIKEEKTLQAWKLRLKLETKWEELQEIENHILTLIKNQGTSISNETKMEEAEMIKKLKGEVLFLENQKKFLQMTLETLKTEHDEAISEYKKKMDLEHKAMKAMYATHEQDKKKIENLEYELQAISKKTSVKPVSNHNRIGEKDGAELKNPEGKWKQQRAEAHDSRRSIDLNTLCSESTAFRCRCETLDEEIQEMKSEILQLKDGNEVLTLKYEKVKRLCRIRYDEINELKEKLKK